MNISDKNLLEIIAKFISDKETFLNFALVSKQTATIVKKLTEIKREEFEHIEFDIVVHDDTFPRVDCSWHGQYTKGNIGIRGTRVWFFPKGLDIVYDKDCSFEELDAFKMDVLNPNNNFPGDCCNLRHEKLSTIIENLEGTSKGSNNKICTIFLKPNKENIIKELNDHYYYAGCGDIQELDDFVEDICKEQLLIETDYDKIWVIRNLTGVIKELKRVLEFCDEHNVTFDWV